MVRFHLWRFTLPAGSLVCTPMLGRGHVQLDAHHVMTNAPETLCCGANLKDLTSDIDPSTEVWVRWGAEPTGRRATVREREGAGSRRRQRGGPGAELHHVLCAQRPTHRWLLPGEPASALGFLAVLFVSILCTCVIPRCIYNTWWSAIDHERLQAPRCMLKASP
jgi:hypothetical protein